MPGLPHLQGADHHVCRLAGALLGEPLWEVLWRQFDRVQFWHGEGAAGNKAAAEYVERAAQGKDWRACKRIGWDALHGTQIRGAGNQIALLRIRQMDIGYPVGMETVTGCT